MSLKDLVNNDNEGTVDNNNSPFLLQDVQQNSLYRVDDDDGMLESLTNLQTTFANMFETQNILLKQMAENFESRREDTMNKAKHLVEGMTTKLKEERLKIPPIDLTPPKEEDGIINLSSILKAAKIVGKVLKGAGKLVRLASKLKGSLGIGALVGLAVGSFKANQELTEKGYGDAVYDLAGEGFGSMIQENVRSGGYGEKIKREVNGIGEYQQDGTPRVDAKSSGMTDAGSVKDMIKRHEGVRLEPYKDSLGKWTIGVGHLIGDGSTLPPEWRRKFTEAEIDKLFDEDFEKHKKLAERFPNYSQLPSQAKSAIIDQTFQMGGGWWKKWKNFLKAVESKDVNGIVRELKNSLWYKQTGKERTGDVIGLWTSGFTNLQQDASQQSETSSPSSSSAPQEQPSEEGTPSEQYAMKVNEAMTSDFNIGDVLKPADKSVDLSGLDPAFAPKVFAMGKAYKDMTGKKLQINSAFRSKAKQEELWNKYGQNPKRVAKPGKSNHNWGLAVDVNSEAGNKLEQSGVFKKLGLHRPMPHEKWHVEPIGAKSMRSDSPYKEQYAQYAPKGPKTSSQRSPKKMTIVNNNTTVNQNQTVVRTKKAKDKSYNERKKG